MFLGLHTSYTTRNGVRHEQSYVSLSRSPFRRAQELSGILPHGPKSTRDADTPWAPVIVFGPLRHHGRKLRGIWRRSSRSLPSRVRLGLELGALVGKPIYVGGVGVGVSAAGVGSASTAGAPDGCDNNSSNSNTTAVVPMTDD